MGWKAVYTATVEHITSRKPIIDVIRRDNENGPRRETFYTRCWVPRPRRMPPLISAANSISISRDTESDHKIW